MCKKFRLLLKVLCFASLVFALERFCHSQTAGFCLQNVFSSLSFDPRWEVAPLPSDEMAKVDSILDQPFFFLGSGGQTYAFLSQDGTTVLKLFKYHHLRSWKWLNIFPLPKFFDEKRKKFLQEQENKLPALFESCKIAYEEFQERSGLFYLHLNKSSSLKKQLIIFDKLGIAHHIDLDQVEFALQKKAELAYPKLRCLLQNKDMEGAKEHIDSLLQLIIERCQKGVGDNDPCFKRNAGFIGSQAVEIDIGSYYRNDFLKRPYAFKKRLLSESKKIKERIEQEFPQLSPYLNERIELLLQKE